MFYTNCSQNKEIIIEEIEVDSEIENERIYIKKIVLELLLLINILNFEILKY